MPKPRKPGQQAQSLFSISPWHDKGADKEAPARPDGNIDDKDQQYSVVELPLVGDAASLPQQPPAQGVAPGPRQRAQQQEGSSSIPWNTRKRKVEEAELATPPLPGTAVNESAVQQEAEAGDSLGTIFEGTAVLALLPNNTITGHFLQHEGGHKRSMGIMGQEVLAYRDCTRDAEWRVLRMTLIDFGSGRETSLLVECTEGDAMKLRAPIEWQGTEAATQERLGQGCQTDMELHFDCQQLLVDAAADKELQRLQPSLCGHGAVVNVGQLTLRWPHSGDPGAAEASGEMVATAERGAGKQGCSVVPEAVPRGTGAAMGVGGGSPGRGVVPVAVSSQPWQLHLSTGKSPVSGIGSGRTVRDTDDW